MSVRAAVVGCGAIAKEHLSFLSTDDRVDLVGVCDSSPATAAYNADLYRTTAYTDLADMLDRAAPAVVHVLTPPLSHPALLRMCLDAGADVICEKPIAISATELDGLLDYASERGRRFIESQNLRFNAETVAVRDKIASGVLGEVVAVDVDIALNISGPGSRFADTNVPSAVDGLPGGAIHDFLPHMVYLQLDLLGFPDVTDAVSRWYNRSGVAQVGFDEMEGLLEFGDRRGRLRFSSRENPPHFNVTARGSEGSMSIDYFNPYVVTERSFGTAQLDGIFNSIVKGATYLASGPRNLKDKILQHGAYHGFPPMLGAFYDAIAAGTDLPVTTSQMRACLAVVDAITADAGANA